MTKGYTITRFSHLWPPPRQVVLHGISTQEQLA